MTNEYTEKKIALFQKTAATYRKIAYDTMMGDVDCIIRDIKALDDDDCTPGDRKAAQLINILNGSMTNRVKEDYGAYQKAAMLETLYKTAFKEELEEE